MYDQWIEEVDEGKMVGAMMVDLSAAFYMVNYNILLDKPELMGIDRQPLNWVGSYLERRSYQEHVIPVFNILNTGYCYSSIDHKNTEADESNHTFL